MPPTASLELVVPTSVEPRTPFIITVAARCAPPGQSITMVVEQRRGPKPFWPTQSKVEVAGEGGVAYASFSVMLSGPGHAVFVATAYDRAGTYFNPDGDTVHVRERPCPQDQPAPPRRA